MFSISDHLTDLMLKESIIQQEDKPIYIFGIKEILSQIYSGIGILIIGFTFGMVWQAVLFTAAYMTLRVYANDWSEIEVTHKGSSVTYKHMWK